MKLFTGTAPLILYTYLFFVVHANNQDAIKVLDRSLKGFQSHLTTSTIPCMKTLYGEKVGFSEQQWLNNKTQMIVAHKLKRAPTLMHLQERIFIFFEKFKKHVDEILEFRLETHDSSCSKILKPRLIIWIDLYNILELTISEFEEFILVNNGFSETKLLFIKKKYNRNTTLINITKSGDCTTMKSQDFSLTVSLGYFVSECIKLFDAKLSH